MVSDVDCGEAQTRSVAEGCAAILGFTPVVRCVGIESLSAGIACNLGQGVDEIFVLPVALDFHLLHRETIGCVLAEARRDNPQVAFHHDDFDPGHPLLVEALADQVVRAIGPDPSVLRSTGLILAPSGHGDPGSRAQSYRLMRLLWERLSLAAAEVGFVRHAQPFLVHTLEKCAQRPLNWVMLPQALWPNEHREFAAVILENFESDHPEAGAWRMADPPGNHPAITAWLTQRITHLWNEKRARESQRIPSPKHKPAVLSKCRSVGSGVIASVTDQKRMGELLESILPHRKPERVLVKVTWHGYATGTYTDPAALDLLLSALPAPAIILEGHTSSRNVEAAQFNWETKARENRAWIRQQDAEYLRRTGLSELLAKHRAEYVNVTEAYWDEGCEVDPGSYVPESCRTTLVAR